MSLTISLDALAKRLAAWEANLRRAAKRRATKEYRTRFLLQANLLREVRFGLRSASVAATRNRPTASLRERLDALAEDYVREFERSYHRYDYEHGEPSKIYYADGILWCLRKLRAATGSAFKFSDHTKLLSCSDEPQMSPEAGKPEVIGRATGYTRRGQGNERPDV